MAARRHIPPGLEGRSIKAPGLIRQVVLPSSHRPSDRLPRPDSLESKIAEQAAEIEQLAGDNHRLAATHAVLRQDLVDAKQEVERLKAQIRSTQTESDIQMRILLDKIAKMEAEIRLGESVKKELRQAHMEAQSLVKAGQELTAQIKQGSQELQKASAEAKSLPDLQAELDNLRHEYKRLRATFEYEKGVNIEKVEQLHAMEQKLIGMARELEKLHADVLSAEQKAFARSVYGGGYAIPDPSCRLPVQGGATFIDACGRPLVPMSVGPAVDGAIPYSSGNDEAAIGASGDNVVSIVPSLAEK